MPVSEQVDILESVGEQDGVLETGEGILEESLEATLGSILVDLKVVEVATSLGIPFVEI